MCEEKAPSAKKEADVFLLGGLQNTAIYASPIPADLQ